MGSYVNLVCVCVVGGLSKAPILSHVRCCVSEDGNEMITLLGLINQQSWQPRRPADVPITPIRPVRGHSGTAKHTPPTAVSPWRTIMPLEPRMYVFFFTFHMTHSHLYSRWWCCNRHTLRSPFSKYPYSTTLYRVTWIISLLLCTRPSLTITC